MIEPTQVIKFSERFAFIRGRTLSLLSNHPIGRDPLFSIVFHPLPRCLFCFQTFLLQPGYSSALFFPLSLFFFFLSRLRRLDKSWSVHETVLDRTTLPMDFYCFPSCDLFHFVTPISKVVCRPRASRVKQGVGINRGEASEGVKISHARRPRDYSSRW